MKLFHRKAGEGKPLVILHGLFGLSDNWATLSKAYAEAGFMVFTPDLRNHGRSPHSDLFTYEAMADDIHELLSEQGITSSSFIGHSMGGKVLMFFSERFGNEVDKMIVSDMAPRMYPPHHDAVLAALRAVDFNLVSSRREAEEILRSSLSDVATIHFLLKNLYWKTDTRLDWRFYLDGITHNMQETGRAFMPDHPIDVPVLFLRGGHSGYITNDDETEITKIFPNSSVGTIAGAGHWIHAEKPAEFLKVSLAFLKNN